MNYFSMFSGIGGFELGIQNAFAVGEAVEGKVNPKEYKPNVNGELQQEGRFSTGCVGYSEIDKHAIKVYERHFGDGTEVYSRDGEATQRNGGSDPFKQGVEPVKEGIRSIGDQPNNISTGNTRKVSHNGHTNYGDATAIIPSELPNFDLLIGGFPCQAFSVAGKREGFNDTRGTLFFDIARILAEKRPRHLVLENVKGLLSHDSGKTFSTIIGVLTDMGYDVEWQVLNSKDFGVPQNRERVFIVGHLRTECRRKVLPITGTDRATIAEPPTIIGSSQRHAKVSTDGVVPTLSQAMGSGGGQTPMIKQLNQPTHSNDRVYGDDGLSPTLNTMQGGNRQPFVKRQPLRFLDRNQKNIEGDYAFTVDASQTSGVRVSKTVRAGGRNSPHGSKQNWDSYEVNHRVRRLTPKECERLQGFPDDWTRLGVNEVSKYPERISDTQRYKMCGNAVTTNAVQAVITALLPCLTEE